MTSFFRDVADPDCPRCGGTGWYQLPSGHACSVCDCRRPENVAKAQARCRHEYVCRICGNKQEELQP